jgi:hypothetical protein
MTPCANCRKPFDPNESTAQDPERFCKSECETQQVGE